MRSFRNLGMRLGLCLLCLVLLAQPVAAIGQSMPALPDSIYTSLVHYSASTGSAVIGQMENGTAVTVLEERGDFYKVDCYDTTGYIAKEQVKLRDGKHYVPFSYFSGAAPENDYMPTQPFTLNVESNPTSDDTQGYFKVTLRSGGADSPRSIQLRQKGDGKWLLWEQYLMPDIRAPKSLDPWR